MSGKNQQQPNVLSHWYTPVPNFSMSTKEFYDKVEAELKAQQVPGLDISRPEISEGGIFSAKRQYLRLTRGDLIFDICACPFGVNYFFSCRMAAKPPVGAKGVISRLIDFLLAKLGLKLVDSYHQEDTRLMYMTVVESAVKKVVEFVTATNGVKLLTQYENASLLGNQYVQSTKQLSNT